MAWFLFSFLYYSLEKKWWMDTIWNQQNQKTLGWIMRTIWSLDWKQDRSLINLKSLYIVFCDVLAADHGIQTWALQSFKLFCSKYCPLGTVLHYTVIRFTRSPKEGYHYSHITMHYPNGRSCREEARKRWDTQPDSRILMGRIRFHLYSLFQTSLSSFFIASVSSLERFFPSSLFLTDDMHAVV